MTPAKRSAVAVLALLAAAFFAVATAVAENTIHSIPADGAAFKVELTDGRTLRSPDLVGAVLGIEIGGKTVRLRIDAVERDPTVPDDAVWLHSFSVQQPDASWRNLCEPGPDGRAQGFPLAGTTRANGTLDTADKTAFSLVCTSSVQAKCLRFGYAPWSTTPDGAPLRDAFDACVTMLRADYAGNNSPTTREGTRIYVADRWNIRTVISPDPGYEFEAGWDAKGAVCVHHPRIRENITLAGLEADVARLAGRTGAICTEGLARSLGALIFNRSKIN